MGTRVIGARCSQGSLNQRKRKYSRGLFLKMYGELLCVRVALSDTNSGDK